MISEFDKYIDALSTETKNLVPASEIREVFSDGFSGVSSQNQPRFFGIAGGVAAGKNTLLKKLKSENSLPVDAYVHDPDDVMLKLPSYRKVFDSKGAEEAQKTFDKPALEIAESMLKYALEKKNDIIYVRTFSFDSIFDQIKIIKDSGYRLAELHGVFADTDMVKNRIEKRAVAEKRTFPLAEAMARTERFTNNFPECAKLFEKVVKWKNDDSLVRNLVVNNKSDVLGK